MVICMEEEDLNHRISGNSRVRDEQNVNMKRLMCIPDLAFILTLRVAAYHSWKAVLHMGDSARGLKWLCFFPHFFCSSS